MRRGQVDSSRQKLLRLQKQLEQESAFSSALPLQGHAVRPPTIGKSSDLVGASSRCQVGAPHSARSSSYNGRQRHSGSRCEVSASSTPRSSLRASSEGPVPRSPRHLIAVADAKAMMDFDGAGTGTSSSSAAKPASVSEDFAVFIGGDGAVHRLEGVGGSAEDAPVSICCSGDGAAICSLTAGGQVRVSSAVNPHEPPRIVSFRVAIAKIAIGSAHAAMISKDGHLFEARGHQPHRWTPKPVTVGRCFIAVACGDAHSLAIALPLGSRSDPNDEQANSGEVFAWGEGRAGQLGLGRPLRNFAEPAPIRSIGPFAALIACGMHHSLVSCVPPDVTEGNQSAQQTSATLFSFGWSEHGRLGPEANAAQESKEALEEGSVRETPSRVALIGSRLHLIAAGAQHSVVATISGELFSFGSNEFGQLGARDAGLWSCKLVRFTLPAQPPSKLLQISCGSTSTLAVTTSGELYSWGAVSGKELCGRGKHGYRVDAAIVVGDLLGVLVRCGQKSTADIVSSVARRREEEKRRLHRDKELAEAEAEERRRTQEEESQRKAREAVRRAEEDARLRATEESQRRLEEEQRREQEEEDARIQEEIDRLEREGQEASRKADEQARRAKEAELEKHQIQEEIWRVEHALVMRSEEPMRNDESDQVEEVEEEEVEEECGDGDVVDTAEVIGSNGALSAGQSHHEAAILELDDVQEAIAIDVDDLEDDVQELITNDVCESDKESRKDPAQCKPPLPPNAPAIPREFVGNHGDHLEQRAQHRRDRKNNEALFLPVLESRRIGDGRKSSARGRVHHKGFHIPLLASAQEGPC